MNANVSIIIPTLNEEKGIVETLKQINELDIEREVLVVDGLSKDNTVKTVTELIHQNSYPKCLNWWKTATL
jgi:glycosyltransferase involved in cell wall biosynthesis